MSSASNSERFFSMLTPEDDAEATESVCGIFQRIWDRMGLDPTKYLLAFETLQRGYGNPDRHYHDFHRILYGLRQFELMPDLVEDVRDVLPAIKLAWLYHDVFCDPSSPQGENERRSADIAAKALIHAGGNTTLVNSVHNLIMVTVHDHDDPPDTMAEKVIVDIDLMSFADAWEAFEENSKRIREEYRAVVPNDVIFWVKRVEVLQKFLDRPHIYYTRVCRELFENQARENLGRAVLNASRG